MRKDFYIFRHGETDYNKEKRWQGSGIDTELNATGLKQAEDLFPKLEGKGLKVIYSSPLKRAQKTAEVVAEGLVVDVRIIKDLREGSFGCCEGMTKSEVAEKFPEIFNAWYDDSKDDWSVAFPEGESKRQIQQRMFCVLDNLLKTKEDTIGIASHGSAIRYLLLGFGNRVGSMANTALYHLIYEDGAWWFEENC